ncbi:MAG: sugar ABC transporter permease [Actinomycetota bacterium]|nr:sugar ABC transporter permease [Actinomycetota bacterium]
MSSAAPPEAAIAELDTLGAAARSYLERIKAGDVGSLPVIVGMTVIVIFFTAQSTNFFTAVNFDNLIVQMAGTAMIAIGVVFVLLLGEIDLSIGYVSGMAGVTVAYFQMPGTGHQFPGLVAIALALLVGALIGLVQGSFVALIGVPSFVVTLAGLFVWQGVIIRWIGGQGVIGIQNNLVNDTANYFLPKTAGWIAAAVIAAGFALVAFAGLLSRKRAGLPLGSVAVLSVRVVFVALITFLAVGIANRDRGVPLAGLLIVAMLAFWTFVARRTTFGRHVYAVGGNAEAARRAGINVRFIRICVFMISGLMAGLGGVILAARLSSVDLNAGGGTILLEAIAAAVIGGTSLFGGRGRVVAALLGALVIATIGNGLSLIGSSAATQFITTGIILLAAVVLDTLSRRRLAASGR